MADLRMRSAKNEIVDREELHRILDEAMVMRLGMLDGERPYVVPLNFAREGDDLWFHAAKAGHKLDCLRAAPAVCVEVDTFIRLRTGPRACDDWSSTYESVIGFGNAKIAEDAAEKLRGLRALMRNYSGREDWEFPDASVTTSSSWPVGGCSPPLRHGFGARGINLGQGRRRGGGCGAGGP